MPRKYSVIRSAPDMPCRARRDRRTRHQRLDGRNRLSAPPRCPATRALRAFRRPRQAVRERLDDSTSQSTPSVAPRRCAGGPGIGLGRAPVVRALVDPPPHLREQVIGEPKQGLDARVGKAIVNEPALLLGQDEAAFAQAPQVVRCIGLGEAGGLDDSPHRQGRRATLRESRAATRRRGRGTDWPAGRRPRCGPSQAWIPSLAIHRIIT